MDSVVPVLFGWVADITVLLLLPLIAILIAIPTTRLCEFSQRFQ